LTIKFRTIFLLTEANLMFSCTGSVRMLLTYHVQHTHSAKYQTLLAKSVVGQTPKSNKMSLSQFVLRHEKPVSKIKMLHCCHFSRF